MRIQFWVFQFFDLVGRVFDLSDCISLVHPHCLQSPSRRHLDCNFGNADFCGNCFHNGRSTILCRHLCRFTRLHDDFFSPFQAATDFKPRVSDCDNLFNTRFFCVFVLVYQRSQPDLQTADSISYRFARRKIGL